MKKLSKFVVASTMLLSLVGCSSTSSSDECTLTVSSFQLSEDIVNEDVIKPFEKQYNCKVVTDLGNAADRYSYTVFQKA